MSPPPTIDVRRLSHDDVDEAARLLYESFTAVYRQRGHTPPFPNIESAAWLCRAYLDLDPEGCALAEQATYPLGVGFAHRRGPVASIGPIAARPGGPRGVGRALMAHFHRLTLGCESVRLFQDSFNPDSFGFYTRLGYSVADVAPYLLAEQLSPPAARPQGVRPATAADLRQMEAYDLARTGADRGRDLALLAQSGSAFVAELGDARAPGDPFSIAGYLFYRSLPARVIIGPAVAESPDTAGDPGRRGRRVAARTPRGDSRLGRLAAGPTSRLRARISRRPPRQPHGGGQLPLATGTAVRALPREPLTGDANVLLSNAVGLPDGGPSTGGLDGRSLRSLSNRIRAR